MTKQVQIRRGTGTQHTSFTGAEGEISVNTTNDSVHVHDGTTTGGKELARADGSNVAFTSGTIDGAVIGGTTPAAGTFTSITTTGDLSLGDNDKAIFGAGSDLQIYHDGSQSRISDVGTGRLTIETNGDSIRLTKGTSENMLIATPDGAVTLYHNNSAKLATTSTGIDVTGTVTASTGTHVLGDGTAASQLIIKASSTTNATIDFGDADDTNIGRIQYNNTDNSMLFRTNNSERMRIDASGNVGIGTSSPTGALFVAKQTDTSFSTTVGTSIGGSSSTGAVEIFGATTGASLIDFSPNDGVTDFGGRIFYSHGSDYMAVSTNGSERMRIDSNGTLAIAKSVINNTDEGYHFGAGSYAAFVSDASRALLLNRLNSDGEIIAFRKDNSTVGSIGVNGSSLTVGRGSSGVHFYDGGTKIIVPANPSTGGDNDATVDLGYSSSRFRNLYLSSGVYLGGTGDANKLDDYEEGTFTPVLRDNTSGGNTATTTVTNGIYTKIGRLVHVDIYFVNIDTSGMTSGNAAYITNLPFTSLSGNNFSTGFPRIDQITVDGVGIAAEVAQGQTYIRLKQIISGAEDTNVIVGDFVSGYADFFLGLTYTTNT